MAKAHEYNEDWNNYLDDANIKALAERFKEKFGEFKKWEGIKTATVFHDNKSTDVRVAVIKMKDDLVRSAVEINDRISALKEKRKNVGEVKRKSGSYGKIQIFVSHASRDKALIDSFIKNILCLGFGISEEEIFYTSLNGMDIKTGDDFRGAIKDALSNSKLVFLIITSNYKMSEVCLNEMGAAWASDKKVITLILDPIDFNSVGVILQPQQIGRLNDKATLHKLHDEVSDYLSLGKKSTSIWNGHVETFLSELKDKLSKHEFQPSISTDTFNNLRAELEEARTTVKGLTSEYTELDLKYKELIKLKDKAEVAQLEEKFVDLADLETLEALDKEVAKNLKHFSQSVSSILLCSYFDQQYEPDYSAYSAELNEATRRKFLDHDGESFRPNYENMFVRALFTSLDKVSSHIDKISNLYQEDESSYKKILQKHLESYKCDLDCSYQDYWVNHFGFSMASER